MRGAAVIGGLLAIASCAVLADPPAADRPRVLASDQSSSDELKDILGPAPAQPAASEAPDSPAPAAKPSTPAAPAPHANESAVPSTPPAAEIVAPARDTSRDSHESVLAHGFYFAPMLAYVHSGDQLLGKNGLGGALAVGFRRNHYAVELNGLYSRLKVKDGGTSISSYGGEVAILAFPFSFDSDLYGVIGGGANAYNNKDDAQARLNNGMLFDVGVGQLLRFKLGSHEIGVRFDARFRHEQLSESPQKSNPQSVSQPPDGDSLPVKFNDVVANVGVVIPFGNHKPVDLPEQPVKVVPVQ